MNNILIKNNIRQLICKLRTINCFTNGIESIPDEIVGTYLLDYIYTDYNSEEEFIETLTKSDKKLYNQIKEFESKDTIDFEEDLSSVEVFEDLIKYLIENKEFFSWGNLFMNKEIEISHSSVTKLIPYFIETQKIFGYDESPEICTYLLSNYEFDETFLEKYIDDLYIDDIITYQKISENFIKRNLSVIDDKWNPQWENIAYYMNLSENFIREFKDKFEDHCCWKTIIENQTLSESLIRDLWEELRFYRKEIISKQKLSEEFIREIKSSISPLNEKFTIEVLRVKKDSIDWDHYCKNHPLSITMVRDFKDYIDWSFICKTYKLGKKFLTEFKDYIKWYELFENPKMDTNFVNEMMYSLGIIH